MPALKHTSQHLNACKHENTLNMLMRMKHSCKHDVHKHVLPTDLHTLSCYSLLCTVRILLLHSPSFYSHIQTSLCVNLWGRSRSHLLHKSLHHHSPLYKTGSTRGRQQCTSVQSTSELGFQVQRSPLCKIILQTERGKSLIEPRRKRT